MIDPQRSRGPWHHRALIGVFSVLLSALIYWLLGFVVRDIGTLPGPDFSEVERRLVDTALISEAESLRVQIEETARTITAEKGAQTVLRDSTDNSMRTMNQLLDLQRLALQRSIAPTPTEQEALRDAQQLFLKSQRAYQETNDKVAQLTEQHRALDTRQRELQRQLDAQRGPARDEYQRLHSRHQLKLAALKLSLLVPLLLVAVALFLKLRGGPYAPAAYAFGIATLAKVLLVMHEHFPRRYFKYVLLLAALALVARVLLYLIRAAAFPRREWVLRQNREAYEHHFCPVCNYPIRRGPLRFAFWTRRSLRRLSATLDTPREPDAAYTCPVCATQLFQECPSCHGIRHAMLPACVHCGAEKPV